MKAALMPHGRYYKITLTRTEARILAEYSTAYSDLLTALRTAYQNLFRNSGDFKAVRYGLFAARDCRMSSVSRIGVPQ